MKHEFSSQIFENYSDMKFNENTYSGSRVVSCGQTGREKNITKLIVAFRTFAKTHET